MTPAERIADAALKPLDAVPVQTYFCAGIQLSDIIDRVLLQTGPARLDISTFSAGEEFLRRLWRLKQSGAVTYCRLICDARAMKKTKLLATFMTNVADCVMVGSNHSKVVLVSGEKMSAAVITSQNLTRGNRTEAGVITADPVSVDAVRMRFDNLVKNSVYVFES